MNVAKDHITIIVCAIQMIKKKPKKINDSVFNELESTLSMVIATLTMKIHSYEQNTIRSVGKNVEKDIEKEGSM